MANVISTVLRLDSKDLKTGLKSAQAEVAATEGVLNKAKVGVSSFWSSLSGGQQAAAAGAVATAVALSAKSAVSAASDLNESINAVNVTFGESAEKILEFGDNAARSVGLAKAEFNELATPLGSILKNAGFDMDTVADKTIVLTQRAADMASVFNTDVGEALGAIQAGLRGEQDPLERFGVGLSAAKVEARALADTGKESAKALTDQEKQLARVEIILDQTNQTAGDFAATSDGLANQTRVLKAEFTNLQAAAGQELIPVLEDLAGSLLTVEQAAKDAGTAVAKIPGVPEFLKTALRFNPVGQQVTFYQELAKAINAAQDAWGGATPASETFNRSINSLADDAQRVADRVTGAADAVDTAGGAAGTAAPKVEALGQAAKHAEVEWTPFLDSIVRTESIAGRTSAAFQQTREDLAALNDEARDNAFGILADAVAAVGQAVEDAFSGVRDNLDLQDLLDDITDQFGKVAEAQDKLATDGQEGIRNYNRTVRDLQRELLDLLDSINGIPPDKKVRIAAEIETGSIDDLYRILGDLTKGVVVPVSFATTKEANLTTFNTSFNPSAGTIAPVTNTPSTPVPVQLDQRSITINYPIGSTPTTQYVDQQLDVRRNGIR